MTLSENLRKQFQLVMGVEVPEPECLEAIEKLEQDAELGRLIKEAVIADGGIWICNCAYGVSACTDDEADTSSTGANLIMPLIRKALADADIPYDESILAIWRKDNSSCSLEIDE